MCHPIPISAIEVDFNGWRRVHGNDRPGKMNGKTGVEMEALDRGVGRAAYGLGYGEVGGKGCRRAVPGYLDRGYPGCRKEERHDQGPVLRSRSRVFNIPPVKYVRIRDPSR